MTIRDIVEMWKKEKFYDMPILVKNSNGKYIKDVPYETEIKGILSYKNAVVLKV